MQIKKFSEIKHLIPKDTWVYDRNKKNKGEFNDEIVIFIEGDAEFKNLDLDAPLVAFKDRFDNYETYLQQEICFFILVTGNLKARNIYNYETDGSAGLIVLGNVTADNMVVGGQEIYILGNLTLKDLFWGEYNHGTLEVKGNITARVFVATNEYHFPELIDEGFHKIEVLLIDDYDEEFEFETLERYFTEEAIFEKIDEEFSGSWEYMLRRQAILVDLENGKPVLLAEFAIKPKESIPTLFANATFSDEKSLQEQIPNFEKLISLLDDDYPEQEFESKILNSRVFVTKPHKRKTDNVKADASVFILTETGVEISLWRHQSNPLKSLLNKNAPLVCTGKGKSINGSVFENANLLKVVQSIWQETLARAEKGIFYKNELEKNISPQEILELTSLPIVTEKYNDWNDDEKHGDWFGNRVYSFCINGFDDIAATLRIGAEIQSDDFDARYYYFRNDRIENPSRVILKYMSSNETRKDDFYSGESKNVSLFDWDKFKEALAWYEKGIRAVRRANDVYLEDKAYLAREQKEKEEARQNYCPQKPAQHITIQGCTFKIIDRKEAQDLLKDVTDFEGNPLYNVFEMHSTDGDLESLESGFFLLADTEAELDNLFLDTETEEVDLDKLYILGYIFKEQVTIRKCVTAYDLDFSPPLICLDDAKINNAILSGATHYFGKNLEIETLWGEYNHGQAYIKEQLNAQLVIADDFRLYIGKILNIEALVCDDGEVFAHDTLNYEDGSTVEILLEQWATHNINECVLPQFVYKSKYGWQIKDSGYRSGKSQYREGEISFEDFLKEGKNPIAYEWIHKIKNDFEKNFASNIQQTFAHHRLKNLENGKSFSIDKYDSSSSQYYYFIKNEDFWQIGYWNTQSHIVAYAYLMADGESKLCLTYYDEKNENEQYKFATEITDNYTVSRVAKRIFNEALQMLDAPEKSEDADDKKNSNHLQKTNKEISPENASKPFTQIVKEIGDMLGKMSPEPLLNSGATDAQLNELQKMIGKKLPEDFKTFYRIFNGQKFDEFGIMESGELLSTKRIAVEYDVWKGLVDGDEFNESESNPEKGIKDDWYNLAWLPITSSGGGDNYCMDLDPAEGGTYGQIITMWHDDPTRSFVAQSFEEWIREYHQKLSNGDLIFSDEYGGIVDKDEV